MDLIRFRYRRVTRRVPTRNKWDLCLVSTTREDLMPGAYRHEDFRILFYRLSVSFCKRADIAAGPSVKYVWAQLSARGYGIGPPRKFQFVHDLEIGGVGRRNVEDPDGPRNTVFRVSDDEVRSTNPGAHRIDLTAIVA